MAELVTAQFWAGVLAIAGVNLVLSGDNAVVIALATRSLPAGLRGRAIACGSAAAAVTRILLTIAAVELLRFPSLKLFGGALLLWIAVRLLVPGQGRRDVAEATGFGAAVRTIVLADLAMSLDNVLAVAAAAQGSLARLAAGLAISVPAAIFASTLLATLMQRYPVVIKLGAALLGWVAGDLLVSDPLVAAWVESNAGFLRHGVPAAGAAAVLAIGTRLAARERELTSRKATPRSPSR